MDLARVEIEQAVNACVVRITGEIDASNADNIAKIIDASIEKSPLRYILDLTGTEYLDSVGIGMLFSLAERLHARRRELHIVVPVDAVIWRVLELMDVGRLAPIHSSLSDIL